MTFEEYFAAKRRWFEGTGAGAPDVAVVDTDDTYATRLEGLSPRTITYGSERRSNLTTKKFSLSSKAFISWSTRPPEEWK